GRVYFVQTFLEDADLTIICVSDKSKNTDYTKEVIGESVINDVKDNIIIHSTIFFYPTISSCGYFPFVELHEILHSLGFSHSQKISSVMYNNTDNCKWIYENKDIYGPPRIDDDIVKELKEIYYK
ncbi:MAG: matrixin family metalloprotease, partial [Candidatus Pacearchaeota archaeon]